MCLSDGDRQAGGRADTPCPICCTCSHSSVHKSLRNVCYPVLVKETGSGVRCLCAGALVLTDSRVLREMFRHQELVGLCCEAQMGHVQSPRTTLLKKGPPSVFATIVLFSSWLTCLISPPPIMLDAMPSSPPPNLG